MIEIQWTKSNRVAATIAYKGSKRTLRDYDGFSDLLDSNPHKRVWNEPGSGTVAIGFALARKIACSEMRAIERDREMVRRLTDGLIAWYDEAKNHDPLHQEVIRFRWAQDREEAEFSAPGSTADCKPQYPLCGDGRVKDITSNLPFRGLTYEPLGTEVLAALFQRGRPLVVVFSDATCRKAEGWRLASGPAEETRDLLAEDAAFWRSLGGK